MNIPELIQLGMSSANQCKEQGIYSDYYYCGQEYQEWLALAIRFVESNFPGDPDTLRFREIAQSANGNGDEMFQPLIAILKAFDQCPPVPPKNDILPLLSDIFNNFIRFDINIKRRYGNRETIRINDEHDLQNALFAILKLFINDIRPEDYVPSYAGANSRVDFLIPKDGLIIETKMTNDSLSDKQVGEQLMIDYERYKQLEGYNHLICFVYDKESKIVNPSGLINDLEKLSSDRMRVTVFISPR